MITGREVLGAVGTYGNSTWHSMWPAMGASGSSWLAWSMLGVASLFVGLIWLGIWIYTSFAYVEIGRKLKYKNPWLAWIPFARSAMVLQLGDFDWRWVFLWSPIALFPLMFVGVWWVAFAFLAFAGITAFSVLCYISHWRFFEKRGYYGWLVLISLAGMIIPSLAILAGIYFLVLIGFVAWRNGNMVHRQNVRVSKAPNPRRNSKGRARRR